MTHEKLVAGLKLLDAMGETLTKASEIDLLDELASELAGDSAELVDAYTWGRLDQWAGTDKYKHVTRD